MTALRPLCQTKLARIVAIAGAAVENVFDATATVLRLTQVEDTQGGFVNEYVATATYPCSFARYVITPREREFQPMVRLVSYWEFTFALDTDIRATDRLLVDDRTFEVVDGAAGSADIVRRVICLEIT